MLKSLFQILLLITLTGFYPPENKAVWIVMQGSSLTVNGSTNINTFQCDIANYNQPDTLTCLKNTPKGMV
ncbi:MAG: hypothetical protein FD183_818, partial [Chitinophagaceae bacterium]